MLVVYPRLPHKLDVGCQPFDFSEDYPLPYGCSLVPTSDFLSVKYRQGISPLALVRTVIFLAIPIDLVMTIAFATAFLTHEAFATALIPSQHHLSLGI
jgi:hypothetical protein